MMFWNKKDPLKDEALRARRIKLLMEQYESTKPKKEDAEDYRLTLMSLKDKELETLLNPISIEKGKLKFFSSVKALNKKTRFLVTMFRNNGTIQFYVINKKGRTFRMGKETYVIQPEMSRLTIPYKMEGLTYIEGNPLPVDYSQIGKEAKEKMIIDAKALTNVIKMEYVELLSKVGKVKDTLLIILVLSGVSALAGVVSVIMLSGVLE